MNEPPNSHDDESVRSALQAELTNGARDEGDWPGIVRRIHRRRASRLTARIAAPALCLLLVIAGVAALSRRISGSDAAGKSISAAFRITC